MCIRLCLCVCVSVIVQFRIFAAPRRHKNPAVQQRFALLPCRHSTLPPAKTVRNLFSSSKVSGPAGCILLRKRTLGSAPNSQCGYLVAARSNVGGGHFMSTLRRGRTGRRSHENPCVSQPQGRKGGGGKWRDVNELI